MKTLIVLIVGLFLVSLLGGCAAQRQFELDAYKQYVSLTKIVVKAQKDAPPLVKLEFIPEGATKPVKIEIAQHWVEIPVDQMIYRPNEWAQVIGKVAGYAVVGYGIHEVSSAFTAIAAAGRGSTTNYNMHTNEGGSNTIDYQDSWNTSGRDWQHGDSSSVTEVTNEHHPTSIDENENTNVNF